MSLWAFTEVFMRVPVKDERLDRSGVPKSRPQIRFFSYLFVCIHTHSSIGGGITSRRRRVWESKSWCSELAPLERPTCKQPCHISRALTRDTVCKKTSGEDARDLRRNLYLYVYMILCTCTHVKSPHTRAGKRKPEGGHPLK